MYAKFEVSYYTDTKIYKGYEYTFSSFLAP